MRTSRLLTTIACAGLLVALPAGAVPRPAAVATAAPDLHRIPSRPDHAPSGSRFAERIMGLSGRSREAAVTAELLRGNLPEFLRRMQAVDLRLPTPRGTVRARIWVMPDYLAVGSDADFVRVPLDFYSAARVATAYGMSLPTRRMVDAIWGQADVHLRPSPMTPGPQMVSTAYFVRHHRTIQEALAGRAPGALVAGHKKDLVLSNLLLRQPPRVAIYGWHRRDGEPIQPLSVVHGAHYADYSHGVRLVSRTVEIGGRIHDLFDVIEDTGRGPVFTVEGHIDDPERILAAATTTRNPPS